MPVLSYFFGAQVWNSARRLLSKRSPVARRPSFLLATLCTLACHPTPEPVQVAPSGPPAPPPAAVVATLTDAGPVTTDPRTAEDALVAGAVASTGPHGKSNGDEAAVLGFSGRMDADASALTFTVDPPTEGSTVWTSPTRVTFRPDGGWNHATPYRVRVTGTAVTRDGVPLQVDEHWSFSTPRPTVDLEVDAEEYGDSYEPDYVDRKAAFYVTVSEHVTKKALRRALTVVERRNGKERPARFRLVPRWKDDEGNVRDWTISPKGRWPHGATVVARIDESLASSQGPLPMGESAFASMDVRPGVLTTVACDDASTSGCVVGAFVLRFDAPLPRDAARRIRVSPQPQGFEAIPEMWREDSTFDEVGFNGNFEPGVHYTVTLDKRIRSTDGLPLAPPYEHVLDFVRPPRELELRGGELQRVDAPAFGVESRDVDDATLSISTLSNAALAEVITTPERQRTLPSYGVETRALPLDLQPGGTWGWDAHLFPLASQFPRGTGAAFIELEPGTLPLTRANRPELSPSRRLVQVTNLGVLSGTSPSGGFVRVLALDTAEPVPGATAHLFDTTTSPPKPTGSFGPSDADGIIRLDTSYAPANTALVVETDTDRVALAADQDAYQRWSRRDTNFGKTFDLGVLMPDRELYQPGERMRVMGWVARSSNAHAAGLEGSGTRPVTVTLRDYYNKVLATATVRTKPYGKFWATLDLPENVSLGGAEIRAVIDGDDEHALTRRVSIKEFVAPAYDVSLALDATDVRHGQTVHAVGLARYLHGMPMPIVKTSYTKECRAERFVPPSDGNAILLSDARRRPKRQSREHEFPLEAAPEHAKGQVAFDVPLTGLEEGLSHHCSIGVVTRDAARQELFTKRRFWVHPSHYVMASMPPNKLAKGKPVEVKLRAVGSSGDETTGGDATVEIKRGKKVMHTCNLSLADGNATCSWHPPETGYYRVEVQTTVDGVLRTASDGTSVFEKPTLSTSNVWSFGVDAPRHAAVGDEVDVQVVSRNAVGTGTFVAVRAGIRDIVPFTFRDNKAVLPRPIDETWVPAGYFDVFAVYPTPSGTPSFDHQHGDVQVDLKSRSLSVRLDNPGTATTGSMLPIDVAVTDPQGNPVPKAHVSIWAVDEGILMLDDWDFPDFTQQLVRDRGNESSYVANYPHFGWSYQLRDDPFEPDHYSISRIGKGGGGGMGSGYGRGSGSGFGGRGKRYRRRSESRDDFDIAPIFVGDVVTADDGTARVQGMLPDNLTTFRIAAVASAEVLDTGAFTRVGRGESRVQVTQELAVRPVLPRVLRPGDQATLGVLVDNLSSHPGRLEVEMQLRDAHGVARLKSPAKVSQSLDGFQVRIPADIEALEPGTVRVWVHATLTTDDGRVLEDASELPLEVRRERTIQRHAGMYGSMSDTEAQAIALDFPPHADGSTHAEVDLYTSTLSGYESSASELVEYPYGCVEQTSSGLLPLVALHGLRAFDLGVGDLDDYLRKGVDRLSTMQTPTGGFAYWPGHSTTHVYGTAYAVWVLSELRRTGYDVDRRVLERATEALSSELARLRGRKTASTDDDIRAAMGLLAIASVGQSDPATAQALVTRAHDLPLFGKAMLAMALHAADADDPRLPPLIDTIRERVDVRSGSATTRAERARFARYFDSPVRTDAMVLLALVRTRPDDPLIEPLARGLVRSRDRGSIRNTQEHAYALLAISGYTALREAVEPHLDVRAWIGPDLVLDDGFEGRDLSLRHGAADIDGTAPRVTLQREGEGRLYYHVDMQWEPTLVEAQANGIAISRELLDDEGPLEGRALVAGEGGTLRATVTTDARHRYVAVELPLPAGLEAVDHSLGRTRRSRGASSLTADHQELRGDRVLVFVDELPAGTHEYEISVRATHEGTYAMPPASAHAMYAPEIAGNSGAETVRVVSP